MSYEIVKSIKVDKKNKEVYITGASNNVWPRTYERWQVSTLTEMFRVKGYEEVIKEILYAYYGGEFQPGAKNDFYKSLTLLDRSIFNWDSKISKEDTKEELYKNYLTLKNEPKGSFIIHIEDHDSYVYKFTARRVYSTPNKESAKVYRRKSDIKFNLRNYGHIKYRIEEV